MTENDRQQFANLISGVFQACGRNIGREGLAIWWRQLASYDFSDIEGAVSRQLLNAERSSLPTIAETLRIVRNARTMQDIERQQQNFNDLPRASDELCQTIRQATAVMRNETKRDRYRCIYSVGYGRNEHLAELDKARRERRPLYDADMAAMARNGWTEHDEDHFRLQAFKLGKTLSDLYEPGHLPPTRRTVAA